MIRAGGDIEGIYLNSLKIFKFICKQQKIPVHWVTYPWMKTKNLFQMKLKIY